MVPVRCTMCLFPLLVELFCYNTISFIIVHKFSTLFKLSFMLWVGIGGPDRVTRTVGKPNVARGERLRQEIRNFGYQEKQEERLTHSQDDLLRLQAVEKRVQSRGRRVRSRKARGLSKGELGREINAVKGRIL